MGYLARLSRGRHRHVPVFPTKRFRLLPLAALLEVMPDIQPDDWDQQQVEKWYMTDRVHRSSIRKAELNLGKYRRTSERRLILNP